MKFLPIIALFAVSHLFATSGLDGGIKIQYGANANTNIVTHVTISPADANGTNLMAATLQATNLLTLGAGGTAATLQTDTNGTIQATSAASDGSLALSIDTSVAHTSGNLVEVKDNGTNTLQFGYIGDLQLGLNFSTVSFPLPGINVRSSYADDGIGTVSDHFAATESQNVMQESYIDHTITQATGQSRIQVGFYDTNNLSKQWTISVFNNTANNQNKLTFEDENGTPLSFAPVVADNVTPYVFGTSLTHTIGNISEVKNNGTNIVQITATTTTSTNTPFILNINGTQKPVFLGPPDSGGTGLRALTVAN